MYSCPASSSESQFSATNLAANFSILLTSSPLISPTLINNNFPSSASETSSHFPSSSSVQRSPPTQKTLTTLQLNWWITIEPAYGFLILFFFFLTIFMIGVSAGYIYDNERQIHASNRHDTESSSPSVDSSSFTDSSFPSSSTKPTSSYGQSKSSKYETTSSYAPTLVPSTNHATSSHRYYPKSTTNKTDLSVSPTLVAPSTK